MAPMTHDASGRGLRIRVFDADRTDRQLSFDAAMELKPSARQLLWIDVEGDLDGDRQQALVERFELDAETGRELAESGHRPTAQLHGKHFHLRVAAEPDAEDLRHVHWLDIVAGPNVVISRHPEPLDFLAVMNKRIASDASIGQLDSSEFVAAVLDSIVTTYHAAVDRLEDELDEIDAQALTEPRKGALFARLVNIRRRIGRLRRLLAAHRELFAALGRPDFGRGMASADPDVFAAVSARFEGAILSLESTRDVVLGSFDILMTQTAQRTNDVMRVLTLATVLALPATVTAGFLGMNLITPLPNDDPGAFWLVIATVALLEVAMLVLARVRGWI
jgi:magnesium transporter